MRHDRRELGLVKWLDPPVGSTLKRKERTRAREGA